MKKNYLLCALAISGLIGLASCGGGSGSKPASNGFFGKVPAIVAEYNEAQAKLKEEEKKKGESLKGKSSEALMKAMTELMDKDKAIKKKRDEALEAESKVLVGKELTVVNNNQSAEISGVKIATVGDKIINFKGTITVKQALPNPWVKCQYQDKDGNIIKEDSGSISVPYEFGVKGAKEGTYDIVLSFDPGDGNAGKLNKVVFLAD